MKKVLKIAKKISKIEKDYLERLDYIESHFRKDLTKKEVLDLYNKLEQRQDRITVPMRLVSYSNQGLLNLKLHIIDGTKLPENKNIDYREDENREDATIYAVTYDKIAISYTDTETYEHVVDIFNINMGRNIHTIRIDTGSDDNQIGLIVFKGKLYVFHTETTTVYDIATNSSNEIKIEGMPKISDMQLNIMKDKIVAHDGANQVIYEIDVENNEAITIYMSDTDSEYNFGFYNGESLVTITEGRSLKVLDKTTGLLDVVAYDTKVAWFNDILIILSSRDENKHIIKIDISNGNVQEKLIQYIFNTDIVSPDLLYGIDDAGNGMTKFDISDMNDITTYQFPISNISEDDLILVLSPTQVLIGNGTFSYYIVGDKELIEVDTISMDENYIVLPSDSKDTSKVIDEIKTSFISKNIKKLIASFI